MSKCDDILTKARMQIIYESPFLGFMLQSIPMEENHHIHTAATNGLRIIYNPVFIEDLSIEACSFILLHELMHIILSHPERGHQKDNYKFNVACDIVVNDILDFYHYKHGELKPILGSQYHLHGNYSTPETIYNKLNIKEEPPILDEHHLWRALTKSERLTLSKIIQTGCELYEGSEILNRFNMMQDNTRHNDWKSILFRFMTKDIHDYSYQRTDKRFEDVLIPDFTQDVERLKNIWVVIDVSYSMADGLNDVLMKTLSIAKQYPNLDIHVSFFSTIVTKPFKVTSMKTFGHAMSSIETTGGTDFDIIFENIQTYFPYEKPLALIIITDGMANYPPHDVTLGIPVLWAINNFIRTPPFGLVMRI